MDVHQVSQLGHANSLVLGHQAQCPDLRATDARLFFHGLEMPPHGVENQPELTQHPRGMFIKCRRRREGFTCGENGGLGDKVRHDGAWSCARSIRQTLLEKPHHVTKKKGGKPP